MYMCIQCNAYMYIYCTGMYNIIIMCMIQMYACSLFAICVQHGVGCIEVFLGILLLHGVYLFVYVAVSPATLVHEPGERERGRGEGGGGRWEGGERERERERRERGREGEREG